MELTHEDVTKLLEAIDSASHADEIDLVHDGIHLRIQRGNFASPVVEPRVQANRSALKDETATCETLMAVQAPTVGRFYRKGFASQLPSEKERRVKAGDIIGIIRVGDQSHEIKAGIDGSVQFLLTEDGSFVEYGQELFIIAAVKDD